MVKYLAPLLFLFTSLSALADERPNIVLIMADDLGFGDLGCYGGEIDTPHLDSLAEEGMRFTQFYNCSRCVPTRQSLKTGLYPQQATSPNAVTLAEVLRLAGYRTLMTGKWHGIRKLPTARGFDRYFGVTSGSCNFFNPGRQRPGEPEPAKDHGKVRPFARDGEVLKPYTPEDPNWYATNAFTDCALQYLEEYKEEDKPFFLFISHVAPHHPLQARSEDIEKYRGKYLQGWDKLREERWKRLQELGLATESWKLSPRDEDARTWEETKNKEELDLEMAVYAAMVDNMDVNIGRVLTKLRDLGKEDNTLVLFLSDNGACGEVNNQTPDIPPGPMDSYRTYDIGWANAGDTPFRKFKQDTFEGGICNPMIAKWPDHIEANTLCRSPAHIMDLMPTFCELAGIDYPTTFAKRSVLPTEGNSMVPLLHGKSRAGHTQLFWEHLDNKAVREGDWKLVGKGDPSDLKNWQLYELSSDRTELNDLSTSEPKRTQRMAAAWIAWEARQKIHSKPKR